MIKLINSSYRKAAQNINILSGLLFSIFSFVYLYYFQGDVVQALHFSLSEGKTYYSYLIGAIIATLILLIIAKLIRDNIKFDVPYLSLSYFPSFLCLSLITDIDYSVYTGNEIMHKWIWLFPLLLLLWWGIKYGLEHFFDMLPEERLTKTHLFISNLSILVLFAVVPILMSNTNINFHHELAVEKAIHDKKYKEALHVGYKSFETSRTLSALRAYAMSLSDEQGLGNQLFKFPQPYGADGLFFSADSKQVLRINADSLYQYLGEKPYINESVKAYLDRLYATQKGTYKVLDYYLSGLLLDKELDKFSAAVEECFFNEDSLPRYYQEALILQSKLSKVKPTFNLDTLLTNRFSKFEEEQSKHDKWIKQKNLIRHKFGDTYWWYYYYQ